MIGRKIDTEYVKNNVPRNELALEVRGFTRNGEFADINLSVRKGEILGIFGLMGAGRTEFLNALYGVTRVDSGSVYLDGKRVRLTAPRKALRKGIAYVTEDRKESGLVLVRSVADNISMAALRELSPFGFVQRRRELAKVDEMISRFSIKTPSSGQLVKRLSGGNQQKVVLGRWILIDPEILILDEPTRGIDVGSKHEIYSFISDLASEGRAVIMVSSELPEIVGMSDRVAVFKEGRLAGVVDRVNVSEETLMGMAV